MGELDSAETGATKVFISYSRKDSAFADALRTALIGRGYDAWIDREDIRAAEEWQTRLENLILKADVVVFLVTDASLRSKHCSWEVDTTLALGKRLVPIAHGPRTLTPPAPLEKLNWVFSDHPLAGTTAPAVISDTALAQLRTAINVDIRWVRAHSELLARAEDWHRAGSPQSLLLPAPLIDGADTVIKSVPRGMPPISPMLLDFADRSREYARQQRAQNVARIAESELQRRRPHEALTAIRDYCLSTSEDVFAWASELSAAAARALTLVGIPYDPYKPASDKGARLGILDTAGLIITASGASLTMRRTSDFAIVDLVTFERPIAALAADDSTMNVLLTFDDGTVFVWNAQTKQAGPTIIDTPIRTQIAKFTSGGRTILTLEIINHGRVWDTATGQQIAHAKAGFTSFADAYFDEQTQRIVAISGFGVLRQWRVGRSQEIERRGKDAEASIRAWHPNPEVVRARFDPRLHGRQPSQSRCPDAALPIRTAGRARSAHDHLDARLALRSSR